MPGGPNRRIPLTCLQPSCSMISGGNTRDANARLNYLIRSDVLRTEANIPPEYCIELCVQSPDAHLAEVPVRVDDLSPLHLPLALPGEVQAAALHLLPADGSVGQEEAAGDFVWRHLLSALQGSQVGRLQVLSGGQSGRMNGVI